MKILIYLAAAAFGVYIAISSQKHPERFTKIPDPKLLLTKKQKDDHLTDLEETISLGEISDDDH